MKTKSGLKILTHTRINKGITLIALVITIIILLILSGITISSLTSENGLFKRAKEASEKYEEEAAREKLEIELTDMVADKLTNSEYNENEYLTKKLEESGFVVNDDTVIVDDWQFQIDRNAPKIEESLGKGTPNEQIKLEITQQVSEDYVKSTITAKVEYEGEIESIKIAGENKEFEKGEDNKYTVNSDVMQNGTYSVYVKDKEEKYKIGKIEVTEITEDMDIHNAEEMAQFRDKVNEGRTFEGKTVRVINDIDLNTIYSEEVGSWEPIGNYGTNASHIFKGTFNGNYHIIDNLYINTTNNYQGLFGYSAGTIENIIINSGEINNAGDFVGGVLGYNVGTISNCRNKIAIKGNSNTGGIVGYQLGGIVKDCYNNAKICVSKYTAGGIVGYQVSGNIYNCYNLGNIISPLNGGGISGAAGKKGTATAYIYNSYNLGTISSGRNCESIIGWPTANGGTSSQVNCYTENATTAKLNEGEYSENMWTDDIQNDDKTWKYNNGYPILKWQLKVQN